MLIVVEGIDRVGKTTLCNKLQEIGCKVFKDSLFKCLTECTNREKALLAASSMHTLVNFANLFPNEIVVLDRFHATEFVYGAIEREEFSLKAYERFVCIEALLEKMEDNYLYVFVEPVDLSWSIQRHGKDLTKHQELFETVYETIDKKNKMKVNFYTLDEVVEKIKSSQGGVR